MLLPFLERSRFWRYNFYTYKQKKNQMKPNSAVRQNSEKPDSEERFRLLFENSMDAILMTGADGSIFAANPAACRLFERTQAEICRLGRSGVVDPSDPRWAAALEQRRCTGNFHGELTFLRRDGSKFPGEVSTNLFTNCDGLVCSSMIIRDVSERKQAEAVLQLSEQKFATLFHQAAVPAALTRLPDHTLIDVNEAWIQLFGYRREEVLGKTSLEIGLTRNTARRSQFIEKLYQQHKVHGFEQPVYNRSGEECIVLVNSSTITVGGQAHAITTLQDITAWRNAELRLQRLNRLYITLGQISQTIQRFHNREALMAEICRVATEFGGYRMAWIGLVDPAQASVQPVCFAGHEQGYLKDLRIQTQDEQQGRGPTGTAVREQRCVICDDMAEDPRMGPWRAAALQRGYLASAAVPIHQGGQVVGTFNVYAGEAHAFDAEDQALLSQIGAEISFAFDALDSELQRQAAEEALRQSHDRLADLSRRLIDAQEVERRAIGRELHDQIGQMLTALKITIDIVRHGLPEMAGHNMATQKLRAAQDLADDLLNRVSRISLQLRPPMLDDLGLAPALAWHVAHFQEQTVLPVDFTHRGIDGRRFTTEIEITVYRLVQEALTNAARHAGASQVRLEVRAEAQAIAIEIQDDGQGFDPQVALARNRGLRGMLERANLSGGSLQIASQPGQGTTLHILLPLQERHA